MKIDFIKIKQAINEWGGSLNQLSKIVGVNHSTISRVYNGKNKSMDAVLLFKLADELGVNAYEFIKKEKENE